MEPKQYYIGIDVGGTSVKEGLFDEGGNLLAKASVPTPPIVDAAGFAAVTEAIDQVVAKAQIPRAFVAGIGLAVPCPIPASGDAKVKANIAINLPELKIAIQEHCPDAVVKYENDANAAAMGEAWLGSAKGVKNVVMVTIGTGVGGGVIVSGEIPAEHIEFSGIGSSGFSGTGWEKRGDRRGTFGSGQGPDMYGGRVFGSFTRSTPGTQRRTSISPDAGRVGTGPASAFGEGSSSGAERTRATFGSGAPRPKKTNVSATVERKVDAAAAATTFAAGDRVSHKTFGPGTVISAAGDMIEVQFERNGQTKKLMKGFAPIVKLT